MAKGLHGKRPDERSAGVTDLLLLVALAAVVISIVGAAHGIGTLFGSLPWVRR